MSRIDRFKVETLSKFSQLILLDEKSYILESCDSIFDTEKLRKTPGIDWFPFLESIYDQLLKLEPGSPEIKFAKVEKPLDDLQGYYDFTFAKRLIDGKERILWSIYDYTDLYIDFMQYQQKRNELEIHRQKLEYNYKTLKNQKEILQYKNLILENIQSIQSEYNSIINQALVQPINILDGLTDMLSKVANTGEKDYLVKLKDSIGLLQKVIGELEQISSPFDTQSNKYEEVDIEFNLVQTLVEVFDTFRDQVSSDVQLNFHIDEDTNKNLIGNPIRLKRIVYSLLLNSHQNDNEAAIQIMVFSSSNRNGLCSINFQISENGKKDGIPIISIKRKEQLVRLSIVKKLILIQGGEILVNENKSDSTLNISCQLPYKEHSIAL